MSTIRRNASGTVNRATVRKLIESGRVLARVSYCYANNEVTTDGPWRPAVVRDDAAPLQDGAVNFDASDFATGGGRAYIADDGALKFRIHSNLVWELRLMSTVSQCVAHLAGVEDRAAKMAAQGDFLSWMGVAS